MDIKETMWQKRREYQINNFGKTDFEWLISYKDFCNLMIEFRNGYAVAMAIPDNMNRDIFEAFGCRGSWSPLVNEGEVRLVISNY